MEYSEQTKVAFQLLLNITTPLHGKHSDLTVIRRHGSSTADNEGPELALSIAVYTHQTAALPTPDWCQTSLWLRALVFSIQQEGRMEPGGGY